MSSEKTSPVLGVSPVASVPYDQEPCVFSPVESLYMAQTQTSVPANAPRENGQTISSPQKDCPLRFQFSSALLLPVFWCFKCFILVS